MGRAVLSCAVLFPLMVSPLVVVVNVNVCCVPVPGQEDPFGVFFIHGERFDGFHNRFLNIARGGLRIVTPNSSEQFAIESSRCYDEVYGLSRAQQLKNKDIPEGGAKAVVLVDVSTSSSQQRYHAMRTSVKAFTDSLLDLIVSTELTRKHVVDWLGFDELVYLGPDEQVVPEDIDWIISQAARRGYPIPAAFMSSKPLAGINHKETHFGQSTNLQFTFQVDPTRPNPIEPHPNPREPVCRDSQFHEAWWMCAFVAQICPRISFVSLWDHFTFKKNILLL